LNTVSARSPSDLSPKLNWWSVLATLVSAYLVSALVAWVIVQFLNSDEPTYEVVQEEKVEFVDTPLPKALEQKSKADVVIERAIEQELPEIESPLVETLKQPKPVSKATTITSNEDQKEVVIKKKEAVVVVPQKNASSTVKKVQAPIEKQAEKIVAQDKEVTSIIVAENLVPISILTTDNLNKLKAEYQAAYNLGQMAQLSQLFDTTIRSNEEKGIGAVLNAYRRLFDITQERNLLIDDLSWQIEKSSASGKGSFVVEVQQRGSTRKTSHYGEIELNIKEKDSRLSITEIIYNYKN
jgi:outer membrane biosynthesis protein TonB